MKVLGIDPGIEITGFAVIEAQGSKMELIECGVIRTSKKDDLPTRLKVLDEDLQELLNRHQDIEVAGVEELFFAKNAKTAFMVGQARGVVLLHLARQKCVIRELKPVEVKSAMTGHGNADKKEIQKMVQLTFGLNEPPKPDDAADAVAVALTAASTLIR